MNQQIIQAAAAFKRAAFGYPRQGAGWPATAEEQQAEAICAQFQLNELGQTPAEEASISAAFAADAAASMEKAAAAADNKTAALDVAMIACHGDVLEYVRLTHAAGFERTATEIAQVLGEDARRKLLALERGRKPLVKRDRRDRYIAL
jgi:hypothetical protein